MFSIINVQEKQTKINQTSNKHPMLKGRCSKLALAGRGEAGTRVHCWVGTEMLGSAEHLAAWNLNVSLPYKQHSAPEREPGFVQTCASGYSSCWRAASKMGLPEGRLELWVSSVAQALPSADCSSLSEASENGKTPICIK